MALIVQKYGGTSVADAEIDQKVYELYGLTEEEKQVIETSIRLAKG